MKNKVAFLVVVHNHEKQLQKLLKSLIHFKYENVFFCEANSSDKSSFYLKNSIFNKNVLYKNKLESFSKNNNDLITTFNLKKFDYLMILNPDTFFKEDFVNTLCKVAMDNPKAGVIAPKILYPNGTLQKNWKMFPNVFHVIKKRIGLRTIAEEPIVPAGNIDWCLGAAMLINSQMINSEGKLFDERYRLYCEDVDICVRAHLCGYKVIGTDKAIVYHELGESSSKAIFSKYNYWNVSSIIKFALKWNLKYLNIHKWKAE